MKYVLRSAAQSILLLFVISNTSYSQGFSINSFISDITIHKNSSITVAESLYVTFDVSKHGIYRVIPHHFTNELGESRYTPIELLNVTNEKGEEYETDLERDGDYIFIRIGSPDYYVKGDMVYVITYQVDNVIQRTDDHDELFWNVTGDSWEAPIYYTEATVRPEKGMNTGAVLTRCFTGKTGGKESNCQAELSGDTARFFTHQDLDYGEGFTIAYGFDKGTVDEAGAIGLFWWKFNPGANWPFLLPILSIIIVLAIWALKGRDPKSRRSFTVRYSPPRIEGRTLQPSETGVVIDEKFDPADLYAEIINLAVNGYLTIRYVSESKLVFHKTDKQPDKSGLTKLQSELLRYLFIKGETTTSDNAVLTLKLYGHKILNAMKKEIVDNLGLFKKDPAKQRKSIRSSSYIMAFVGSMLAFWAVGMILAFTQDMNWLQMLWKIPVSFILATIPVFLISFIIPRKTKKGAEAYQQCLEFEEFLSRAEKDVINRLDRKDIFFEYLPYAIALNVADRWADAFEELEIEVPGWAVGLPAGAMSTAAITASVISGTNNLRVSLAYASPRSKWSSSSSGSSFSSSGGFSSSSSSGGGFGGGGGGSW